jgi:hypothetical protein
MMVEINRNQSYAVGGYDEIGVISICRFRQQALTLTNGFPQKRSAKK